MHRILSALCAVCLVLLVFPAGIYASEEEIQALVVSDDEGTWLQQHNCDLFRHAILADNVVHPGSAGRYAFTLSNTAGFDLAFTLSLRDENLPAVPMEFRLRSDGAWFAGDENTWLAVDEVDSLVGTLRAGASYALELDWRWVYTTGDAGDAHDTDLGETAAVLPLSYTVTITIQAEADTETDDNTSGATGGGGSAGSGGGGAGGLLGRALRAAQTGDLAPRHLLLLAAASGAAALVLFGLGRHIKRRQRHG